MLVCHFRVRSLCSLVCLCCRLRILAFDLQLRSKFRDFEVALAERTAEGVVSTDLLLEGGLRRSKLTLTSRAGTIHGRIGLDKGFSYQPADDLRQLLL